MTKNPSGMVAATILIVLPATLLIIDNISGLGFIIAMFWGSYYLINKKTKTFPFNRDELLLFYSGLFLYLSAWITVWGKGVELESADRFLTLCMFIPVYFFFKKTQVNEKIVWLGLMLGVLITCAHASYEVFVQAPNLRAHGTTNPIFFGSMSLFMGLIVLMSLRRRDGWFWVVAPVIVFGLSVFTGILSGSRIVYIEVLVSTLWALWYIYKFVSKKATIASLTAFIIISISIYTFSSYVEQRIDRAVVNGASYLESNDINHKSRGTSTGVRFEMWKGAWMMFLENPVLGVGWGEYHTQLNKYIDQGKISSEAKMFHQPHNNYFSALSRGGILGFIGLLAALLIPLKVFYSRALDADPAYRCFAFGGVLLTSGFMVLALTADPFQSSKSILSFVFFNAVLMAMIQKIKEDKLKS